MAERWLTPAELRAAASIVELLDQLDASGARAVVIGLVERYPYPGAPIGGEPGPSPFREEEA